jgi:hypothetical protein
MAVGTRRERQRTPALDRAAVVGGDLREPPGDAPLRVAQRQHERLAGRLRANDDRVVGLPRMAV